MSGLDREQSTHDSGYWMVSSSTPRRDRGEELKKSAHKNIHQTTSTTNHCDDDNDNNMPKYIPIKNMILVCLPQRHTFVRVKRKNRRGQMSGFGMIKYVYYAVNLLYLCLNYSPRQQIAEKSSYSIGDCLTFCSFQSKQSLVTAHCDQILLMFVPQCNN